MDIPLLGELAMGVAARSTPQLGSGAITEDPLIDRHKTLVVDVTSEVPIEFLASGRPHPRELPGLAALSRQDRLHLRRRNLGWKKTQSTKQVRLRLVPGLEKSGLCGDHLGKKLAKLPQFDEACIGVIVKIAFCERTQSHELNVVLPEKKKIARLCPHDQ
jgi:hypothetical protein